MSGKVKYDWPTPEKVIELVRKHGTRADVAAHLGVSRGGLDDFIRRHGIGEQARAEIRPENAPIPDEVSEEEVLRERLSELERAHKRQRKEDVLEERVVSALEGAVEARKPQYSPRAIPKSQRTKDKHEFVLLWSDPHAGEVVSREETNGINEYDWDIMMRRHDRLREGIFSYQDNRPYPVEKLHVIALGDMVGGNIHDELAETNEFPVAEVAVQFGMDGATWIESLTERFGSVNVAGVTGNHGRLASKPRAKQSWNGWDWVSYHTMRLALRKAKNIDFIIPKAAMWPVTVAKRWRILAWHGDGVRSTMPGVPWGGVMRRASALQNQYTAASQPIDVFAVGHFHSANLVEGSAGRIAMNGSIKGVDEYTLKAFGSGRHPQQLLLTFHPKNGLTDCSIVDLEQPTPAGP